MVLSTQISLLLTVVLEVASYILVGVTSKIGPSSSDDRADRAWKCDLGKSLTTDHGLEGALTILGD